jgi:hypothetical protein
MSTCAPLCGPITVPYKRVYYKVYLYFYSFLYSIFLSLALNCHYKGLSIALMEEGILPLTIRVLCGWRQIVNLIKNLNNLNARMALQAWKWFKPLFCAVRVRERDLGKRFGLLILLIPTYYFEVSAHLTRRRGGEEATSSSVPFRLSLEFLQFDIPATSLCKATVHLKLTLQQHGVLWQAEQRLPVL